MACTQLCIAVLLKPLRLLVLGVAWLSFMVLSSPESLRFTLYHVYVEFCFFVSFCSCDQRLYADQGARYKKTCVCRAQCGKKVALPVPLSLISGMAHPLEQVKGCDPSALIATQTSMDCWKAQETSRQLFERSYCEVEFEWPPGRQVECSPL